MESSGITGLRAELQRAMDALDVAENAIDPITDPMNAQLDGWFSAHNSKAYDLADLAERAKDRAVEWVNNQ